MIAHRRLTVNKTWLEAAAVQLERDAEDSLPAWVILGQAGRYAENMAKAHILRRAAQIKNIGERREYLRNNGVEA